MEQEKVAVNIKIGSQVLPLKATLEMKEIYELAEKRVNDILSKNKDAYSKYGIQFELSMAAFQLAYILEEERKNHKKEMDQLEALSDKMNDFLKK
ncbi:MAG: cell division protein ZapA [Paludibacteraceae bacterium]|nr:cell division protein ZapA [Paludibacteraceae bacterium]